MQRCSPDESLNEDQTSESDEDQDNWIETLIGAAGPKVGKLKKDPVRRNNRKIVKSVRQRGARTDIPSQDENIKKSPGIVTSGTYAAGDALTRSGSGMMYQWQYLEFTLHCAFQADYEFASATEMIGVGKLDDVVLFYKNHEKRLVIRCVQLKYSIDKSNISPSELLKDDGNYSVSAYFTSWLEIEGDERFRDIRVRNMILCTTKGLDVEYLKKHEICCDVVEDPDKSFELKSGTKEAASYRFSAIEVSNQKLYDELRGCVSRKLAKLVAECVYKNKAMRLEVESFRDYHLALRKYVFDTNNDTKTYKFRQNFIEGDNLSPKVGRFRQRFLFAYREIAILPEKLHVEKLVWEDIKERFRNLPFQPYFGISPKVPNPREKSEFPEDINDREISKFLEDFTLVTHLPGKTELDAMINRKIRDHNQCSEQRADQISSAFRTEIQKFFSVKDNKGNRVPFLTHKVCKQILDKMEHKVDSLNELLRKPVVKFQGHETCFGKLLDIRDSHYLRADELEDFVNMVDSKTVFKIILGEEIRIGEGLRGLREIGNEYINRTIYRHVVIEKDIFCDVQIPDLFVISGIDGELTGISVQIENTSPAMERNLTKFTILKNGQEEEQFRAVCVKNPRRNIHWLKKEAGKYIWKRSQGDITYLFKYRDPWESEDTNEGTDATYLSESDLAAHCKPVIISDTAGMGKSTLLTYLAEKMKENEPDLLVLQIDLIRHTAALDEISRKKASQNLGTIDGAVQFLVNELLSHRPDLDREVFKRLILKQRKVALIVDGFDKISPEHGGFVIDLLQALSNYGIKKMFVTSRRHTMGVLERKLNTFACAITPLSAVNQEDLLIKYWASKRGVHRVFERKTAEHARKSAKAIINTLAGTIENRNRRTGTPLLTYVMAYIFEEDVKQGCVESRVEPMKVSTPAYRNRFFPVIDREFRSLLLKRNSEYPKYDDKSNTSFTRARKIWALNALFGEDKVREWLLLQEDEPEMLDIAQEVFITHCVEDMSSISKQICTERWAAGFFTEMLIQRNSTEPGRKFFAAVILLDDQYNSLRSHLDDNLHGKDVNALVGDQSWIFHLNEHRSELNETVFHVAAAENNLRIIELFLNCLSTNPQDQKTLVNAKDNSGRTAVHWAVEHGNLEPIKLIVEHTEFEIDSQDSEGATPLYRAAPEGNLSIVKYLLDKNANIHSKTKEGMTPLDAAILTNKCDVVEYLCSLIPGAIPNELALETSVTK